MYLDRSFSLDDSTCLGRPRTDGASRTSIGDSGSADSAEALRAPLRLGQYYRNAVCSTCPRSPGVERRAPTWRDQGRIQAGRSAQVNAVLAARGGVQSADGIASRMRPYYDQPISQLARWIVKREIVTVPSQSCVVPLFQFDQSRMTLKTEVTAALAELVPVFDDLEVANWFIEPSRWLGGLGASGKFGAGRCCDAARGAH